MKPWHAAAALVLFATLSSTAMANDTSKPRSDPDPAAPSVGTPSMPASMSSGAMAKAAKSKARTRGPKAPGASKGTGDAK